jgi:SecD/SecF fusion protein
MNPSLFPILLAANKYRIINYDFPVIGPESLKIPLGPLIVLLLIVASIAFGILMANSLRMRDYGWKIGLILSTVLVSTFVVLFGDFKLGVDLKGGVILVYEVNELETAQLHRGTRESEWNMGQLIAVLTRRLNPTGLKEIIVRPFGPKQVEIVVRELCVRMIRSLRDSQQRGKRDLIGPLHEIRTERRGHRIIRVQPQAKSGASIFATQPSLA